MNLHKSNQYLDLVWAMTWKEFSVRYKQAIFGFLWVILNPLLQMLVIGFVFSYFMNIPNYFIFLFSGLLPWQFFSQTVSKITPCFVHERAMLQKAAFPREVIPLSIVLSSLMNFILSIVIFMIAVVWFIPIQHDHLWLLLPALVWITALTTSFSLLTSSLNVRFRDVAFFVQTIILLWFYATPILYSLNQIPPILQKFLQLNPLVTPIAMFQSVTSQQPIPFMDYFEVNALISAIVIIMGAVVFIKESPYFVDWL